eukprot:TRINITY_DN45432_c0_g1_i3.p1 TRINITY_DN45432_c0_g1~~TRINITY_DN45432_c0_g1_i3.p1  ORF type:complete len:500 (+),score=117.42 TRINITY_DN45432_c0_g1_i3:65-1564(+)
MIVLISLSIYSLLLCSFYFFFFFFQAEDGIRDAQESRGLGDVYKRQVWSFILQGAMDLLHENGYVTQEALSKLDQLGACEWTSDENSAFLRAIYAHNKDFKKVSAIVGTKSLKEVIGHYLVSWKYGAEHSAWKQAKREERRNEFGVPRSAEIVTVLRGEISCHGHDQLRFKGRWGNHESDLFGEMEYTFVKRGAGLPSSPEKLRGASGLPGTPGKQAGGVGLTNPAAVAAADWPPSGTYTGMFVNGGEPIAEQMELSFSNDLVVKGGGSNSLVGTFGLQGVYTVLPDQVVQCQARKWYLPRKRNPRDLFYLHLWPLLIAEGWKIERGNRVNDLYFLPPNVPTRTAKGFQNRKHYFDSRKQVLQFLSGSEQWAPQHKAYLDIVNTVEGTCSSRQEYTKVYKKQLKDLEAKRRNHQDMPPPSPGGHDSFCLVCQDVGELLVCDGCVHSFHLGCLDPPVKHADDLPDGDWFCEQCLQKEQGPSPGEQEPTAVMAVQPEPGQV